MWQRLKSLFSARFSLREMILATTAVAGLFAAFYVHRPFRPTAFVTSFRPQTVLDPLVKAKHPEGVNSNSGGGTLNLGNAAEMDYDLLYAVTTPPAAELLQGLKAEVRKAIEGEGCEITGWSTGELSFGFYYERSATMGFVKASAEELPDRIKIRCFAYEHR